MLTQWIKYMLVFASGVVWGAAIMILWILQNGGAK